MSLTRIFEQLYADAAARERPDARGEAVKRLGRGAAITVRTQGRKRQVLLGRQLAPVGEAEIDTFRRDGGVPSDAERRDYAAGRWHYVALTWDAAPTLFDLPPADAPAYQLPEVADLPDFL